MTAGGAVLVSAGDASGDAHAADLVAALRRRRPGLRFTGMGGPCLEKAGVEIRVRQEELAVGGLLELLPEAPRIARAWRRMRAAARPPPPDPRPDLAVLVDSPGFHLPLARALRREGVPVLWYVAPQVWAWRRGRMRRLARRVDRLAVILPFERALWEGWVPVRYVGHPRLDAVRREAARLARGAAREALGLAEDDRVVALFPGSRRGELRRHLPLFLETARALHARDPGLRFLLAWAPSLDPAAAGRGLREARLPARLRLDPVSGRSLEALAACDAALLKPGTATLEAALLARPMVVTGRVHPLSAAVFRRLSRVPWLAMPNLVAGRAVVPELLQEAARPRRLAEALLPLLAGPERERQLAELGAVRDALGSGGAAERTADLAEELLGASP